MITDDELNKIRKKLVAHGGIFQKPFILYTDSRYGVCIYFTDVYGYQVGGQYVLDLDNKTIEDIQIIDNKRIYEVYKDKLIWDYAGKWYCNLFDFPDTRPFDSKAKVKEYIREYIQKQ